MSSFHKNIIVGLEGLSLTKDEIRFILEHQPLGFILFTRNCQSSVQIKQLTANIKKINPNAVILIDQEGGRINRLEKLKIRYDNSTAFFGRLRKYDPELAFEAVMIRYKIISMQLYNLGINVNCAPVLDLHYSKADAVIGNRSFGKDKATVIELGKAAITGMRDTGVFPVIKHIPGHGRAMSDSHIELPVVESSLKTLENSDFSVFKEFTDVPMAMTAHVLYNALDDKKPATISKNCIQYIRNKIKFKGILISDDINMGALSGSLASRTKAAQEAGCDVILHCSGILSEMEEVAQHAKTVQEDLIKRLLPGFQKKHTVSTRHIASLKYKLNEIKKKVPDILETY